MRKLRYAPLDDIRGFGREAEAAFPYVRSYLGTSWTRQAARCIVAIAPPEDVLPPLIEALRSTVTPKKVYPDLDVWTVRPADELLGVIEALEMLGPEAAPAVPVLEEFHALCLKVLEQVEVPTYFVPPARIRAAIKRIQTIPK